MKKSIIAFALIAVACSSKKDEKFCECLTVSSELNDLVADVTTRALDKLNDGDAENLKALTDKKNKACADYEELGGEELLKKKEACK